MVKQPLAMEYALLGFLLHGPLHAYEIHRSLEQQQDLGLVWHIKQSLLYVLLSKLEDEGFLTAETEYRGNRPPRKLLHLTATGREAFFQWCKTPVEHGRDFRQEFMAKLFFAQTAADPTILPALLDGQRAACRQRLMQLEAQIAAVPPLPYEKLVLQFRSGQLESILQWLDTCQATLLPPPVLPSEPGLIDLSHTIEHGLITYRGLPAPIICDYLSREDSRRIYAPGTEFQIGKIEMVTNTGTYVDCPFHRYADGKDLAAVELARFADLPALLVRADQPGVQAIDHSFFAGRELRGRAVLVYTGWARHWNSDAYFDNHPFLTEDAAVFLRDSGALLVGIDAVNIDDTRGGARPVHSTLLAAEILIVEHLCRLELLPDQGFTFSAVPPKFKGVGTFPVRAFARL
jgi:kynurenine formamidase/DNA-binding PadR family transcriptional regulator